MFFENDFNYVFKKNGDNNLRLNVLNKQSLNSEKKAESISNNKNPSTSSAKMSRDAKKST